jgi:hypothetical protein
MKRHCYHEDIHLGTLLYEAVQHAVEHVEDGGELPEDPSWDCVLQYPGGRKVDGPIKEDLLSLKDANESITATIRRCLDLHLRHCEKVRARLAMEEQRENI